MVTYHPGCSRPSERASVAKLLAVFSTSLLFPQLYQLRCVKKIFPGAENGDGSQPPRALVLKDSYEDICPSEAQAQSFCVAHCPPSALLLAHCPPSELLLFSSLSWAQAHADEILLISWFGVFIIYVLNSFFCSYF